MVLLLIVKGVLMVPWWCWVSCYHNYYYEFNMIYYYLVLNPLVINEKQNTNQTVHHNIKCHVKARLFSFCSFTICFPNCMIIIFSHFECTTVNVPPNWWHQFKGVSINSLVHYYIKYNLSSKLSLIILFYDVVFPWMRLPCIQLGWRISIKFTRQKLDCSVFNVFCLFIELLYWSSLLMSNSISNFIN